ncbi:DUF4123 domain-containing protein [Montanilutibacter psychrotolerans]|uniref:DUF4123 domain-containing protein n=1 Tax=Montanilutibacter psychrotolerans TaxID=1327343 RepID=UPI0016807BF4|nr:DUF4123 domain-containing protein [Lysobacter psychrotolerans]
MSESATAAAAAALAASYERLLALVGHGQSLHAVIDPVLGDPFQAETARSAAVAIAVRHPEMKAAQFPYLLPLGDFGRDDVIDRSLAASLRQAMRGDEEKPQGRSICGWVVTDAAPGVLAAHLAERARLRVGQEMKLLRFWDPRVLDLLQASLKPAQVDALLGPARSWSWLARDGSLRSIARSESAASHVSESNGWQFDSLQVRSLFQAEHVNRTLDVLQDMGHAVVDADLVTRVAHLIGRGAKEWGLETDRDQVTYALYGVLVGEGFDRVEDVRAAMAEAWAEGMSPIDALDRFDEQYWTRLGEGPRSDAPTRTV